jgi:phosphopantothenoylcysteine decarboxylase/phosphopantothenate--cysteine ligase
VALPTPERVQRVDVVSAQEMLAASLLAVRDCDIFIGVAAVADYRPASVEVHKIKKSGEAITIALVPNPDIIGTVAALETRPFTVGFAAETQELEAFGLAKLQRKKLDLLFANDATDTFGSDEISAIALWPKGRTTLGPGNKQLIARQMLALVHARFVQQDPADFQ